MTEPGWQIAARAVVVAAALADDDGGVQDGVACSDAAPEGEGRAAASPGGPCCTSNES